MASIFERGHMLAYTEEGILDALWIPGSKGHMAGETGGKRSLGWGKGACSGSSPFIRLHQ